ncbi:MAG: TraB/GumN family protein [Candidatus Diapherotrites archaeon]|nr:TraB/GumN family protein [Candidatus Diapherotrites archaeon]
MGAGDVERIRVGESEIILVGTAHVSADSVELVRNVIAQEQPDSVGVELDLARLNQLKMGPQWRNLNLSQIMATGQVYLLLFHLLASSYQRSLGQKLGVMPGTEMLEAVRIAESANLSVVLLDRDVRVTMQRAMQNTGFIEKLRLLVFLLEGLFGKTEEISAQTVERLKETDVLNDLLAKLGSSFPSLKSVLVDERDAFIARRIQEFRGRKLVAVLGKGHLNGVKSLLEKEVPALREIPRSRMQAGMDLVKKTLLQSLVAGIFLGFLGYAVFFKGIASALEIVWLMLLFNGGLAALGVLLARGHPLSALTALLAAPIGVIHPLLATGWFAGAMEARLRAPQVKDFEELGELNSLGDFSRNKVTSILLVVALANLGSMIGSVVVVPLVLSVLVG